jgi:hypothetical protein
MAFFHNQRKVYMKKLTLVRGLPGSGKSTYAKSLGCLHFEQDQFLVRGGKYEWSRETVIDAVEYCKHMTKCAMVYGLDIVVANVFAKAQYIDTYIELAKFASYEVTLVEVRGDFGSVHSVPPESMKKMRDMWEHIDADVVIDNTHQPSYPAPVDPTMPKDRDELQKLLNDAYRRRNQEAHEAHRIAQDRGRAFVAAYLSNGFNATQAAIAAGYSPKAAAQIGCDLMRRKDVAELLALHTTSEEAVQ